MAPGIPAIEGSPKGHDVIKGDAAIQYLEARGHTEAVAFLNNIQKPKVSVSFKGSSSESVGNRSEFGKIVCDILARMTPEERQQKVLVVDSDLEGSCGLDHIHKNFPEVFVPGGVMERGNVSAAAGFGFDAGKQGIFATFSAFLEMVISEVTMARLNNANLLCHFSHAGVDEIADNTCHFGINNFLADSALPEGDTTRLYFPADGHQFRKALETIFNDPGIRFIFSNRSKLPYILKEDGSPFFGDGYTFERGKDDVIREAAQAKGWSDERLYQNRGRFSFPLGQDYGLVCFVGPDDELGEITETHIEIIHTCGSRKNSLRFANSDVFPPRIRKADAAS